MKKKNVYLVLVFGFAFIIFYPLWKPSNEIFDTFLCERYFSKNFHEKIFNYRQCLVKNANTASLFSSLNLAVNACMDKNLWNSFQLRSFYNYIELKRAILPTPIDKSEPCTEVTLGIGKNIIAEVKLRRLMPHCQFHGADPILESGSHFRSIGKYHQIAVGAESGITQASVLDGLRYKYTDVKTVNFSDFLKHYVKSDRIDYLWMDNEGAEYEIFRKYLIDNVDVTICQIDTEMHGPLDKHGMDDKAFNELLLSILSRSPFLPIWSDRDAGHVQTLYINVVDPYCLKKYFLFKFCARN